MTKDQNDTIASINIRIHPDLKTALDQYCIDHIEKIAEAVTSAIKSYIGFGKPPIQPPVHPEKISGKTIRLDIRVNSRLKTALFEYCKKNQETVTDAVTKSLYIYIGFKK